MRSAYALEGVIAPIPTPLDESGNVDQRSLERLVEHLVGSAYRVDSIFALGSMGEGLALTEEEKESVINYVVDDVSGRVPVLVGATDTSTKRVLQNVAIAANYGADAAVVTPTPYFKHTPKELEHHFREIARNSEIPVIIYNIPSLAGQEIDMQTVMNLSGEDNIIGLKDTSHDIGYFEALAGKLKGTGFKLYTGDDSLILQSSNAGGHGAVSGVAVLKPESVVSLLTAAKRRDFDVARQYQETVTAVSRIYEHGNFISAIKTALELEGIIGYNGVTEPFEQSTAEERKDIARILEDNGFLE